MLTTSHLTLKRIAAFVWYTGVAVLLVKSGGLFLEAERGGIPSIWVATAIGCGLLIGLLKAKYLFVGICKKNLARIYALEQPMIWQGYRVRFYFFLFLMVSLSKYMYRLVQGNNQMLLALAVLELSIGIALLGSSYCFWRK